MAASVKPPLEDKGHNCLSAPAAAVQDGQQPPKTPARLHQRDPASLIPAGVDAGDLVLFNRRCMAMAPLGAAICGVSKALSNSRWDHVGVVVRKDDGKLYLLEANLSGVTLRPLEERLRRSRSNEIALRRLSIVRNDRFRRELSTFAEQVLETPYQNNLAAMLSSVIRPADKQERERLHALLVSKQAQRAEVERELRDAALTAFQRRSLLEERKYLLQAEEKIAEQLRRQLAAAKGTLFEGTNDLSRVFCSELVAAAYQRLGLLGAYPPADSYSPKDFSTEQMNPPALHLLNNARLSREEFIRKLPDGGAVSARRQRHGGAAADEHAGAAGARVDSTAMADDGFPSLDEIPEWPRGESREIVRDALKRSPIFTALSDEYARNHLIKSFRPVIVEAGDYVFHQGDYGDAFYVVERGVLDRFMSKDGQEALLVSTVGPRNSFGLTALFFNAAGRSSTVRARERSLLWRLDRATFERFALDFGDTSHIQSAADRRQLRAALKKHFLFTRLDRIGPQELDCFFTVTFRPGETVFEQGEEGDNFYIVKRGELERWIHKPNQIPKLSGTLQAGDSFGELSLMYNAPRGATVRARTEVELWAINAESFHRLHLGGGAVYLQRIFEQYASVRRPKRTEGNHTNGSSEPQEYEVFMTPSDFLRFAKADALAESPQEYQRLCTLLLRLVSNHSNRARPAGTSAAMLTAKDDTDALIDFWEFVRFDIVLNQPDAESQIAFRLCDRENTGLVGMQEFQEMFLEYASGDAAIEAMVEDGSPLLRQLFGKHGTRKLNFREFTAATEGVLPPQFVSDIQKLKRHMLQHAAQFTPGADEDHDPMLASGSSVAGRPGQPLGRTTPWSASLGHVLSVAVAGAVSRTAVAPLDRLKVLMQTEWALSAARSGASAPPRRVYSGVFRGLQQMVRQDGWRGMFRGNGANVLRIMPATVIQAASVALVRRHVDSVTGAGDATWVHSRVWDAVFIAGLGGIAAATATYPLDLIRARLTVQHRSDSEAYRGVWQGLQVVRRQECWRGVYRGLLPSVLGVFPYVGINFAVYEALRPVAPKRNDGSGQPTAGGIIFCGFVASTLGQLAAYPLDTCRLRMQVDGGRGGGFWRLLRQTVREEGVRTLYRGLVPNILKAWPTVAASYYTFELARDPLTQFCAALQTRWQTVSPVSARGA